MRRRTCLRGFAAMPLVGFVRPDALPYKRAAFEEVGNSVLLTVSLPALFRRYDREALASLDSGFDTRLVFTLKLWQHGSRRLIATTEVLVKVRRDPWKKRYVVAVGELGTWTKRTFVDRDAAIAAAVRLERIRVAAASDLERGEDGPYYFVSILAQRNPLDVDVSTGGDGRGQGRDLEWFGRLVDVLAGERAQAEETVHVRTNPFYLVPR